MDELLNLGATLGSRFTTNVQSTLANMSPEKWIRIIIVAGAYLLLRPYIIKLGGRSQMKLHEQEAAEAVPAAALSPNDLRGQVKIPEDSSDSEDDEGGGKASGAQADWGKKARRRQRHMIKRLLEAEEKRLEESKEEEEDKDIEEFLIKG
ncbi:protein trafficking Pga2 [Podospora conica]|nr:protein trafficking Pga2 [Schizothecium conicum]